jgi:hypothetical protein
VASNRSKLGYYAEREWRPLRVQGAVRTLAALRRDGVRQVILEEDAIGAGGDYAGPLRPSAGLALSERHRVEANGRVALVCEIEGRLAR